VEQITLNNRVINLPKRIGEIILKRVFIVGGTGFLGYHAASEFISNGWDVTALGLPPAAQSHRLPGIGNAIFQDLDTASEKELVNLLHGHTALVFAAGLDDRFVLKKPAYPKFHKANVENLARLMSAAKEAGVTRLVVLGSYFTHFNRLWPELKLAEKHPYIRSRLDQENIATSFPGLDGMVLELPYIFGALPFPGWKPLWSPLVQYIRSGKTLFYMKGGTACISARTVGRAIVSAVERGEAGACYPIGQENLTWIQMLSRLAAADGRKVRIVTVPVLLIHIAMQGVLLSHNLKEEESGLNLRYFAPLQTTDTFIDPELSRKSLGYELDDLDKSFRETVAACNHQGN
jgi:dihydroflavonol-4-reductase